MKIIIQVGNQLSHLLTTFLNWLRRTDHFDHWHQLLVSLGLNARRRLALAWRVFLDFRQTSEITRHRRILCQLKRLVLLHIQAQAWFLEFMHVGTVVSIIDWWVIFIEGKLFRYLVLAWIQNHVVQLGTTIDFFIADDIVGVIGRATAGDPRWNSQQEHRVFLFDWRSSLTHIKKGGLSPFLEHGDAWEFTI